MPSHRRRSGPAAAVAWTATAILLAISLGVRSHRPLDPASAQPAPTPTPSVVQRVIGAPIECDVRLFVEPRDSAVTVGTRITVTVAEEVACPNHLEDAAVVVFLGGAEPAAQPAIAAAIDVLGRVIDDSPDTPLAVIDAAAPASPVQWANTHATRRAALDALAAGPFDRRLSGERWAAGLRAASAALAARPPNRRPVLVVLDGLRPPAFELQATTELQSVAAAVRDGVGRSLLIDLSADGWLASFVGQIASLAVTGFDGRGLREPAVVAEGVQRAADGLVGKFDLVVVVVSWVAGLWRSVPGSASPLPSSEFEGFAQWRMSPRSRPGREEFAIVLESVATGSAPFNAVLFVLRDSNIVAQRSLQRNACIHPPGADATFCLPTPEPTITSGPSPTRMPTGTGDPTRTRTPTPAPTRTSRLTPTPTPTRTPRPTLTRRPTATAVVHGVVWLPIGYAMSDLEPAAGSTAAGSTAAGSTAD